MRMDEMSRRRVGMKRKTKKENNRRGSGERMRNVIYIYRVRLYDGNGKANR